MKRVLIVGAGSYVGDNVKKYLEQSPEEYEVDVLDARGLKPKKEQFVDYDSVFYVAGIVHIKESKSNAHLYYEVNRDLAIGTARMAKEAGVKQFILMSTMAVYGITEGVIRKDTIPDPATHYGRSKLEADKAIEKMADDHFKVAILRPPMVYGKGCKGNYQKLRWLALHTPVFPYIENQRSMLYIGNLCWFVKGCIDEEKAGLFFPQNAEYVNTSGMVSQIARVSGKKIKLARTLRRAISILPIHMAKKAFGSLIYEKVDMISEYGMGKSIEMTEGA